MNIRHHILSVSIALGVVALSGCTENTDYNFEGSLDNARQQLEAGVAAAPAAALFDPARGVLPFPDNLLFAGSDDGTLNLPLGGTNPNDLSSVQVSLNALDGFSTTAPITASLSSSVNAGTVVLGQSVRVFEVQTAANTAVTQVTAELDQSDVAVSMSGNNIVVIPIMPLKESTDYMVVVTNQITGTSGTPLRPSASFSLVADSVPLSGSVAGLEPVRQSTNAMLAAAATAGVDASSVVLAWTFKTQSITPVMQAVKGAATAQTISVAPTGLTTKDANDQLPGIADLYIGSLELPYYRVAPSGPNDVVGINSYWQGEGGTNLTRSNPVPRANSIETVPVLLSVPNANSGNAEAPLGGWPIAIFVHGITSNRSAMVAIADAMAQAGIAVIAIDLPMHGITDPTSALSAANSPFPNVRERTFNIDLVNNDTGAPAPDGIVDTSGRHFNSPQFLLAGRDNLRQSVADLFVLSASIANIQSVPLNPLRKTAIGHSLGGTVVTPFVAFDDSVTAASLGMPAAGLIETNLSSGVFGPPNIAALAASGLQEGTPEFAQFKIAAQTVIDSGDAINFGALAASNTPIHLMEVIGEITVPNSIAGVPLAGTEALARVMGLAPASASTTESAIVRFTEGDHSSLLLPTASGAATQEMQSQVAAFSASAGALLQIGNSAIIQ